MPGLLFLALPLPGVVPYIRALAARIEAILAAGFWDPAPEPPTPELPGASSSPARGYTCDISIIDYNSNAMTFLCLFQPLVYVPLS